MNDLKDQKCEACRSGSPLVTRKEIDELMPHIPNWQIIEREGIKRLVQTFKFSNFAEALSFTTKVGEQADEEGHHPAILTEWGKVTVTWWSRKIKGLHKSDFIMAAKTDNIA